ncbi:MAG TPA: glycosyltransferase family 4 protein [Phycisphaerales bacterium]|nr:glycosyltransferase family 4 protein [Phycisphaerales bacterium]
MRWLIVSSRHHPSQGGIGAYVASAVRAAVDAGWDVHLLTRPSSDLPPHAKIHPVITLDDSPEFASRMSMLRRMHRIRPYRYGLWALAVARSILELNESFDLISCVDTQAEGLVALTSSRVRRHVGRTPMIIHAHGTMSIVETLAGADPCIFGRSVYHEWEHRALLSADAVCSPSNVLQTHLPVRDHSYILPPPVRKSHVSEWQVEPVITFVGGLEPNKGPDVLACAMNAVFQREKSARMQFIGPDTPSAPDGGSMQKHVQSLIEHRYRDRVSFLCRITHEQVLDHIARSLLVVVPSRFESFSYAAAEAIMIGRPVIVTTSSGIVECLPQLPSVPFGDAEALADAIVRVFDHPQSAHADVMHQREVLMKTCSPCNFICNLTDIGDEVSSHCEISGHSCALSESPDAIDEMQDILTDIEHEESLSGASPIVVR